MWAITPYNVGESVAARKIKDWWDLRGTETFAVDNWDDSLVLDESEIALRSKTQAEIDAPDIDALRAAAIEAETAVILAAGTTAEAIAYQQAIQ